MFLNSKRVYESAQLNTMAGVQAQYSLSWQSFQANIANGFSHLQQNGEFVDMTLAADGHLVKVHQVVVAIASPYLKELITSAPCPHPVIHLHSINFVTLCSLLEYIYTGEVLVSADNINNFMEAARALHIRGLEDMMGEGTGVTSVRERDEDMTPLAALKSVVLPMKRGKMQQVELPKSAQKIHVKTEFTGSEAKRQKHDSAHDFDLGLPDARSYSDDDDIEDSGSKVSKSTTPPNLQFTISNRGYLQVILNRYLYNLNSTAQRAGVRRWRCVDYRNKRCPAYVVTRGNLVINRGNLHNHQFHDKKILDKIDRKVVYSAIGDITGLKVAEKPADPTTDVIDSVDLDDSIPDDELPDLDSKD